MLFMAKVAYVNHAENKKSKHNKDLNETIIVGHKGDGEPIAEQFYRVVAIESFQMAQYNQDINEGVCSVFCANNGEIKSIKVDIPLPALEAITEAAQKIGHPLQGKIIDLRPDNHEKISTEYKNKTGMFAYLKKQAYAIS